MRIKVSELLKSETSEYHRRLDQQIVPRNLMSPELTQVQYEVAICCFYVCFTNWQATFRSAELRFSVPTFALIECHLNALQQEVDTFNYINREEVLVPKLTIDTLEDYLGYSYVLTGAQLGAKFILRSLKSSTLRRQYTFSYYEHLATQSFDIIEWKACLDKAAIDNGYNDHAIINAAKRCFTQLTVAFEQNIALLNKQSRPCTRVLT